MDVLRTLERQQVARKKFLKWLQFHLANRDVYEMFERLALQEFRGGHRRYGAREIWERLRWELKLATDRGHDKLALNNDYTPFYARLTMLRNRQIGCEFFECRPGEYDVDDEELLRRANELDAARAANC